MDFSLTNLKESLLYGLRYLPVTIKITLIALVLGILFGLVIAILRYYKIPVISQLLAAFVTIYQGIPTMVALLIFNLLFSLYIGDLIRLLHLGIEMRDVDNIVVGYFTLSVFAACSISETFRGALLSVDKTQFEAGYSIGLTKVQTLRRIIIPQVIPVAIPGLINNMVGIVKGTSLVMAIGIMEVMSGAVIPCSRTYSFVEGYTAAALIYWGFTLILENVAKYLERYTKKYRKSLP